MQELVVTETRVLIRSENLMKLFLHPNDAPDEI